MPYNEEMQQEIAGAQDLFVWEIPAWEKHERGPRWYVIMSIVAIGFVAYAVLTGNFLFAFLILFMAILMILTGNQEPPRVLVQIGHNGIVLDGRLYEFRELENFSIIYQPPETKIIYFEQNSSIRLRLRLPLDEQNPIEIRNHLKQYIQENLVLQDEHISDILARLLRI